LEIERREQNKIIIFDIKGEVKRSESIIVSLHQLIKSQLREERKDFLLNFENVDYFDSFGVGELVASYKSVQDAEGKLKIANMPPKIHILFKITMLDRIFEIFDDEETAVQSF
jgi:anti-anti-sigma factor